MNLVDIIIVVVVLVGFILGYKDGFVRKLIGLIGLGAAIFLAAKFASAFGQMIDNFFGIEFYLSKIIAGVLIFLCVIVIFSIIKRLVHPFDKVNNLINQIAGGVVGVVQILFFLSAVFFLLNIFNAPSQKVRKNSLFYQKVYDIIPSAIDYLNNYTPETKKFIKEYINEKDSL